jgi:hypothetical protein
MKSVIPEQTPITGLLGPSVGYVDLLDEHITKKQIAEAGKAPERNPLRPSNSGSCSRKIAYEYNEYKGNKTYDPEIKEPNIVRLLNLGSSIEYNVLRQLGEVEFLKVLYKQQVLSFFPVNETEVIEGSIDFVVYLPGHRAIGDVKSKGDKFSSFHSSKWNQELEKLSNMSSVQKISDQSFWVEDLPAFLDELNDPFFADNFIQLNLYAMNPFIRERNIDHAFILRYNKNDSRLMEVRFKPSQVVYDYVQEKYQRIAKVINETKQPELIEREYNLGSVRCAFCRFKQQCWPEQDALKSFFRSLPPREWPKDTDRLDSPLRDKLEGAYADYCDAEGAAERQERAEEQLINAMRDASVNKARFEDGRVYELKQLKSPPRIVLRRSKA